VPFTNVVDIHTHSLLQEISSPREGAKRPKTMDRGSMDTCCGLGILELQAYYKLVTSRPLLPLGFRMQIVKERSDYSPTIDLLHAPYETLRRFAASRLDKVRLG
jgi:hypothetical protein